MSNVQPKLLRGIDHIALALLAAVNILLYYSIFWLWFHR